MKQLSKLILSIIVALSMPTAARAITGYFDDSGGGRYWCNVYVASVSSGKSYSWCTGDDEDRMMDRFREFSS
ncbi:MAG: hypothetical protein IJ835_06285 [Muribaculaceae bacterium]|nr:hypothetical protein [Muribaculaceae bacterium]